jgi:tetratricopeptide (TPR) repeat protein
MFRRLRIHFRIRARKFEKALSLFPAEENMSPMLLIYRAHIFSKILQYEKAKQDLDKLKERKKLLYYAYNNQGYIYLEQRLYHKAIPELEEAKRLMPKHSFATNNLGFVYMMTSRVEEGIKLVEEALKLDRHNYYTIRNIGVYYLLKKQYSDAIMVFNKAKMKDKTMDDIDNYIAICQFKMGDIKNFSIFEQGLSANERDRLEKLKEMFS